MEFSEKLEKPVSDIKNWPYKNLSENDMCSKRLSIIPEEETEDENLHIVGFKVKVDGDQAYSFALEKTKSKSADTFTTVDSSKRIFGRNVLDPHHDGCRGVRKFFKVPQADEQSLPQAHITNLKSTKSVKTPALELKLGNENKEFELHIKSKNDGRDFAHEDENPSSRRGCYDTVDQLLDFEGTNLRRDASCYIKSLKEPPGVPLKYIIELSSTKTQTEKETESTSAQTTSVEVLHPRSMQEAEVQTDRKCDASTSTERKEVVSLELETEEVLKKQVSLQTDIERVTGSSQTETAELFSIDRVYGASTQTDQLSNAGTSTDFNIYIVDREKISEKAVNTEDLPYAPLMVAREEKAEEAGRKLTDVKCCHCSYDHENQHECIYKCYHHRDCETMFPAVQSNNQQSTSCGTSNCSQCSCCSEKRRMIKMRSDIHQQYCCQSRNLSTNSTSNADAEAVEKLKPPDTFQVPEVEYSSFGLREKISSKSKVEIIKNLELNRMKTMVAVREQIVPRVERAAALKIPVIFQHFLNSFSLSVYSPSRVVINPISISMAANQSDNAGKKFKSNNGLSSNKGLKNRSQTHLLIYGGVKENSVIVSYLPSIMATDDKHAQVRLCKSCNTSVQSVLEKKRKKILQFGLETDPNTQEGKLSGTNKDLPTSTSPKIKHKKFDYTATDAWTPFEPTQDAVLSRKVEATDIIHVGDSDSDQSVESADDIDLNSACETVNDHLLSLRPVDKDAVRKAAQMLHKYWFDTAASKHSDVQEVRYFMRYFEEFSNNLLRTLLHSVDNNGNNVFHFAFANNRFDLVEELLGNRFSTELLKKTNKSGNSPLMICSISQPKTGSDWSAIRKCFELGDVNSKSLKSGQTPLMNAASCGFNEMVDVLLDAGANPNLQDKDGSTALMYAAEHGHENCSKTLVRHRNCDPTIKDKDGQTACSIALSNGHKNVAVLIHMQALEKRQTSKHSHSPRRYIWTNNESKRKALNDRPRSHPIHSAESH